MPRTIDERLPPSTRLPHTHGREAQASPEDPWLHYALGAALEVRGDLAGAIACYDTAKNLNPSEPVFVYYCAAAHFRASKGLARAMRALAWLRGRARQGDQDSAGLAVRLAGEVAVYCCERGWFAGVKECMGTGRVGPRPPGRAGQLAEAVVLMHYQQDARAVQSLTELYDDLVLERTEEAASLRELVQALVQHLRPVS